MLEILESQSVIDLKGEKRASKRDTEESGKCACHSAESVLPDDILILLLEEIYTNPACDGCTYGNERGLRSE